MATKKKQGKTTQVKNLIVHYIDVGNIATKDVPAYIEKAKAQLQDDDLEAVSVKYFIPVRNQETRVEVLFLQQ